MSLSSRAFLRTFWTFAGVAPIAFAISDGFAPGFFSRWESNCSRRRPGGATFRRRADGLDAEPCLCALPRLFAPSTSAARAHRDREQRAVGREGAVVVGGEPVARGGGNAERVAGAGVGDREPRAGLVAGGNASRPPVATR